MATAPVNCFKVKPLKDLEEIHALLREFHQFEVVIGPSEETFRLTGTTDNDLDDLCEVHLSRIPSSVSLAQLVRLCISPSNPGGPASLVRLTLFVSRDGGGSQTRRATATYQNEEHAMSAELELNGVVLTEDGMKRPHVKPEPWALQPKGPTVRSRPLPSAQQQQQPPQQQRLHQQTLEQREGDGELMVLLQQDQQTRCGDDADFPNSDKPAEAGNQHMTTDQVEDDECSHSNNSNDNNNNNNNSNSNNNNSDSRNNTNDTQYSNSRDNNGNDGGDNDYESNSAETTPEEAGLIATTEMGRRLYVANIPKNKTQPEILAYFQRYLSGVTDVVLYTYPGSSQNRGFCFVEFTSTKKAMVAKDAVVSLRPWGCEVVVDWADPEQEPGEHIMKNVKVLYIKNITPSTSEEDVKKAIEDRGIEVERVKIIRDFGFVHFVSRERAEAALKACENLTLGGQNLKVSWAKPPLNKHMREEVLRRRERRMRRVLASRYSGTVAVAAASFPESHLLEAHADPSVLEFGGYSHTGSHGQGDY